MRSSLGIHCFLTFYYEVFKYTAKLKELYSKYPDSSIIVKVYDEHLATFTLLHLCPSIHHSIHQSILFLDAYSSNLQPSVHFLIYLKLVFNCQNLYKSMDHHY